MNNINFDSLTNIKAPDHFIKNALDIPNTTEKKKPLLFFKNARTLAAVACLVFASIVSVVLYLASDNTEPQIDPNNTTTQSVTDTEQAESSSAQVTATENRTDDKNSSATTLPTQPYKAIEPSEDDTADPTQSKSEAPTQSNTQSPDTQPTSPLPDNDIPSEDLTPNEPLKPIETMDPSAEPPTEGREPSDGSVPSVPASVYFTHIVSTEKLFNGIIFYCKVYSPKGDLIGDSDLYSTQHQAYAYYCSTEKMILSYELSRDYFTESGTYTYYFYDQYGDIICHGTETI